MVPLAYCNCAACVVVRGRKDPRKKPMYIVTSLYLDKAPRLGVIHVRDTLEEAIDIAVQLAVEQGADEAEAREELTNNLDYLPEGGEWSVCIGQSE